jgi:hypothetical protein
MLDWPRASWSGALVGALLSGGCGDESVGPFDTVYVDFSFVNQDRSLCVGAGAHLDRYIERVFEFFDRAVPEDLRLPVRVLDYAGSVAACSEISNACYDPVDRRVYIEKLDSQPRRVSAVLRHELTHAVIDKVWGSSVPFFAEGLAEMFSSTPYRGLGSRPPTAVPVAEMLDKPANELDYDAAALFTRFLIDTRGRERFGRLFRGARGRSRAGIESLAEDIYGETFAALEAEFLDGSPRCLVDLDLCDARAAVRVGERYEEVIPVSCQDPEVYGSEGEGFEGEERRLGFQRTLEIVERGTYRVDVSKETIPYVTQPVTDDLHRLVRCGGCDGQREYRYIADAEVTLEAGLYTFELDSPFDAIVTLVVERVDG